MPLAALRQCKRCPQTAEQGSRYCIAHASYEAVRSADYRSRNMLRHLYSSRAWRALRSRILAAQPICLECNRAAATEVHHVKRATTLTEREFFNATNLKATCKPCHSRTTATEVGFAGSH
jgi:5-methylcytosine-specific restriction enzyme A